MWCWKSALVGAAVLAVVGAAPAAAPEEAAALTVVQAQRQPLPDTSAITGELTEKHGVSKFFSLWLVFNDPAEIDVKTGVDYVILAPREPAPIQKDTDPQDRPAIVKKLLLDHVILGQKLNLAAREEKSFSATTLGGRDVHFTYKEGHWYANNAVIVEPPADIPPSGELVVLDNYAFSDYDAPSTPSTAAPKAEASTEAAVVEVAASSEPAAVEPPKEVQQQQAAASTPASEAPFKGDLAEELSKIPEVFNLKRVPIFNEFLPNANVSALLKPGEQYTVLFPMDRAFQSWHPIDWGFYPFSVPEFTAEIIRSHFLHGALKLDQIQDQMEVKTLTNRTVVFKKLPSGEVLANGVPVMRREVNLQRGTVMVVSEILFVNHQVVQELRMHNRDKETPPLIAFPWWNAQFLSHAFLGLESNATFPSMEKLLSVSTNLHHRVPGRDYSFLVPTEDAFKKAGLEVPTWWSERLIKDIFVEQSPAVVEKFLLKYLIKGRLYMKELTPGRQITALDNSTYTILHKDSAVYFKHGEHEAKIVEGNHFVYNLGTIFFVDSLVDDDLSDLKTLTQVAHPTEPAREIEETTEHRVIIDLNAAEYNFEDGEGINVSESSEDTTLAAQEIATEETNTESNAIPTLPSEP